VGGNCPGERSRFSAGLALATITPLVLAPLLAPSDGRGTNEVLGVLVVVAYAGHLAVTGLLWRVPEVQQAVRTRPGRLVAVPVALVVAASVVAFVASDRLLAWLLIGYFAWQFSHFQRQNLGLAAIVTAQWDSEPLRRSERRLVIFAGWCGSAALLAHPALLDGLIPSLPPSLAGPVVRVAALGLAGCAIGTVVIACHSKRPALLVATNLAAVLFFLPVFAFKSTAAAVTGMVVAHGLQYLWAVGWRRHPSRPRQNGSGRELSGRHVALAITGFAVVGGALLSAMSELHGAHAAGLRLLYGAYLGIAMAHFAVDSVIWRRVRPSPQAWARLRALLPSSAHGGL